MIFDHKPIEEISNSELNSLVQNHTDEGQYLEYKETYTAGQSTDISEVLKDIASLANGGGGYLIIGIQDDGHGKAKGYRPHTKEKLYSMQTSIKQLCLAHIEEKIPKIEFGIREPNSNPILVIHIPESDLTPHMVKYNHGTVFCSRYNDVKREMSFPEIRSAFQSERLQMRLESISHKMDEVIKLTRESQMLPAAEPEKPIEYRTRPFFPSTFSEGTKLAEAMYDNMKREVGKNSYFWISATPTSLSGGAIDINSPELHKLIASPPGSRRMGWNMELDLPIQNIPEGVERGQKDYEYLALYNNAYMEFWTPLGPHFCYRQEKNDFEKRPELYPYPVVEFPTTFLYLYKSILETFNLKGQFIVNLRYLNLKGHRLRPTAPKHIGYTFATNLKPFQDDDLVLPPLTIDDTFDADSAAYQLMENVYGAFGYGSEDIPFYHDGRFIFPS